MAATEEEEQPPSGIKSHYPQPGYLMPITISPYQPGDKDALLDLSLAAWAPVFAQMSAAVPSFVYANFYPDGWETRQRADLAAVLDKESECVRVARRYGRLAGWLGYRLHPEDRMGEIYVLAVAPEQQRCGVGRALMDDAFALIRSAGMAMVMVETGADPGHQPARAAYEATGFVRWPVARYFKTLSGE